MQRGAQWPNRKSASWVARWRVPSWRVPSLEGAVPFLEEALQEGIPLEGSLLEGTVLEGTPQEGILLELTLLEGTPFED